MKERDFLTGRLLRKTSSKEICDKIARQTVSLLVIWKRGYVTNTFDVGCREQSAPRHFKAKYAVSNIIRVHKIDTRNK